jgi:hypothetical protein
MKMAYAEIKNTMNNMVLLRVYTINNQQPSNLRNADKAPGKLKVQRLDTEETIMCQQKGASRTDEDIVQSG